jgi:hypothetical protein
MDAKKQQFLTDTEDFASAFANLVALSHKLENIWILRTYIGGGAQAMTDEEAGTIGITAAEMQTGINLMVQLQNLYSGAVVSSSNQYQVFIQKSRR